MAAIGESVWQKLLDRVNNPGIPGLKTGFYDLDEMTQGLQRGKLVIVAARPAMGKCLGKGTRVVMFDGTTKAVEDVRKGDQLMGPDSNPREVLSLCQGRERMYWVRQNKGIDYRVNESHVLSLKRSGSDGQAKHGDVTNISVRDYLSKSAKFQMRNKGYKVPIDFPTQDLPINPYLLGVWLGDGSTRDSNICNPDVEIHQALREISDSQNYRLSTRETSIDCPMLTLCGTTEVEPLKVTLRRLGVIGNKHIPQIYLSSSRDQRLELLAGLMDSDGYYCSSMNCFENTQKVYALASQMKFLADSLGFRTSIIEKIGSIAATGFKGVYWRVRVSGNLEIIPTKVARKQARMYQASRDWRVTGIKVELDKVDDYYGFSVDGDHLFLLEDMTVTHNSGFSAQVAKKNV